MLRGMAAAALGLLLGGCIRSVHGNIVSGPPMPAGKVRLLTERPGSGQVVIPGDRIVVDFVGRYANGEIWGQGPLTLVAGWGTYPGLREPLKVGAAITMQFVTDPNDTASRLISFQGGDSENEAFQVRRDRGQIIVEHQVREVCRQFKLVILKTDLGDIEPEIGCWPIARALSRRPGPRPAESNRPADNGPVDGKLIDPPVIPRPAADTSQYLGGDGLRRAVREGRPEVVGWLLRHGRDVTAADSFGLQPIHYVGWAQHPAEHFVPAFEQSYVDVLDTLLSYGAMVDAPIRTGQAASNPMEGRVGQTVLGLAASECADRLVRRRLDRGARPDARPEVGLPAMTRAARNGCPETVAMLLEKGATVDLDPIRGGTPLEQLIAVGAFHQGHLACAELLVKAGAKRSVAAERLADRLRDPGTGGFGFSNRPMARRILELLRR